MVTKAGKAETSGSSTIHLPIIQNFQPAPAIHVVPFSEPFVTDTITDIASAGDERLFVAVRGGLIYILQPNGERLPTPFLDIHEEVVKSNWEQGLLGIVFHPNYPATPYFYVSFTSVVANRVHVMRYSVSQTDPNVADEASATMILRISKTESHSLVHNGGDMSFGPDGYLYIGIGDGGPDPQFGSTNVHDPANNGHRLTTLLGKILRIDVDGNGLPPQDGCNWGFISYNYTIPPDNPFADGAGPNCDEIWARGLRNPWRFSFNQQTGDMFVADVGEWEREEVNVEPAGSAGGLDYGWRCWEGTYDQTIPHPIIGDRCSPQSEVTFPVYEFDQSKGCSIVGGFVYHGSDFPSLQGHYVLGDFCNGSLKVLSPMAGTGWFKTFETGTGLHISTFGEDANGELYMGTWNASNQARVYRVEVVNSATR
jgi:glucose/arabinose dehydrogenase